MSFVCGIISTYTLPCDDADDDGDTVGETTLERENLLHPRLSGHPLRRCGGGRFEGVRNFSALGQATPFDSSGYVVLRSVLIIM